MRKEKEISLALDLLDEYGGPHRCDQSQVLRERINELQVFDRYVRCVGEDAKDEERFFAVRDAARYLAGKLELGELIPDMPAGELDELMQQQQEEAEETITISSCEFKNLLKRVERLERRLGLRSEINKTKRKDAAQAPSDLISQAEACRMLGCGKSTIKRWADNGFITGYVRNLRVYYSKKELNRSDVVKEYRALKTE